MRVDRINYSESREYASDYGLKHWVKVGMEATISPDEEIHKSIDELKQKVKDCFLPSGATETLPLYPVKTEKTSRQEQIEGFITAISLCQNKESLDKLFKKLAENTPELQDAYNQKLQSFKK